MEIQWKPIAGPTGPKNNKAINATDNSRQIASLSLHQRQREAVSFLTQMKAQMSKPVRLASSLLLALVHYLPTKVSAVNPFIIFRTLGVRNWLAIEAHKIVKIFYKYRDINGIMRPIASEFEFLRCVVYLRNVWK